MITTTKEEANIGYSSTDINILTGTGNEQSTTVQRPLEVDNIGNKNITDLDETLPMQNVTIEDNFELIGEDYEFLANNNSKLENERAEAFADGDINFGNIYKNNAYKNKGIFVGLLLSLSLSVTQL